jgi:hypothetical protein
MLYALAIWIALTLVVVGLISYRYFVSLKEDDILHLADAEAPLITEQNAMAARLGKLDRLSRQLTLVDVVFGLCLGVVFIYNSLKTSGLV